MGSCNEDAEGKKNLINVQKSEGKHFFLLYMKCLQLRISFLLASALGLGSGSQAYVRALLIFMIFMFLHYIFFPGIW